MKNRIQKVALLLVFAFALTIQANAQNNDHSLAPNSKSLQFGIGQNFTLSSYSGTAFSYKRHTTSFKANRIGLSLNNSFVTSKDPDAEGSENKTTAFNLNATYTWMNYTDPAADIKFYYGYGPGFGFSYDKENPAGENNSISSNGLSLSAVAYTGVEWFFHGSISLHAEYGGSLALSRLSVNREAGNDSRLTTLRLGSNGVMFGISAYF